MCSIGHWTIYIYSFLTILFNELKEKKMVYLYELSKYWFNFHAILEGAV